MRYQKLRKQLIKYYLSSVIATLQLKVIALVDYGTSIGA